MKGLLGNLLALPIIEGIDHREPGGPKKTDSKGSWVGQRRLFALRNFIRALRF